MASLCAVHNRLLMTTLHSLIATPGLAEHLTLVTGDDAGAVGHVDFAEMLTELDGAQAAALIVLGRAASATAGTFEFELALRVAASRSVRALVLLTDAPEPLTPTAIALAERADVAVLTAPTGVAVADVLFRLRAELSGGGEAVLNQLATLADALAEAHRRGDSTAQLAAAAQSALQFGVRLDHERGEVPVIVDTVPEAWLTLSGPGAPSGDRRRVVLEMLRPAIAQALSRDRRRSEAPIESRAELLSEFLHSDEATGAGLLQVIRTADVPVDGWHVVTRIEPARPGGDREDELGALDRAERIARVSVDAARAQGGLWYRAQVSVNGVLLMRMDRSDPGPRAGNVTAERIARVLSRLRTRMPETEFFCGVSGVHQGASGLRSAAAEARSAVAAARTSGTRNEPFLFDAVGLRRMLVDWYASDATRQEIDEMLAPLDGLGAHKARTAIETLRTYLDNNCSLARTAEALHLHRNAVAYRISRIGQTLAVDLDDADQRLVLQLACRARGIG